MKKYISVVSGVVLQICLGGIYAFSSYVPALSGSWGYSSVQTQLVFGLTFAFFTVFMIPFGKLLRRTGPRRLMIISGILFLGGHILASLAGENFILFLFSYILVICPAMAAGYVCPVSCSKLGMTTFFITMSPNQCSIFSSF